MAKLNRKKGATSQILHVFIQDSSSLIGAGLTGLAYTGAGITPTVKYINAGGTLSASITLEDITTLGTYAAPTSNAHMRFKEINSASPSQGVYEIHVHNDWMNLTGGSLVIMMAEATNMAQFRLEIDLQADANITHVGGTAQTARDLGASVLLSSGTGTGQVSLSSGAVLLQPTQTGVTIPTVTTLTNAVTVGSINTGVITTASIVDGAITPAKEYVALGTVSAVSTTLKVYTALGVTGERKYNNMCLYSASNGERSRILSTGSGFFNVRGFSVAPADTTVLRIYTDGCL